MFPDFVSVTSMWWKHLLETTHRKPYYYISSLCSPFSTYSIDEQVEHNSAVL